MSLYYEQYDIGYQIDVLNPHFLSSIREAYLSRSLAKKNTNANAKQCSGMLEVVSKYTKRVAIPLFKVSSTVDHSSNISDNKYTQIPIAHARPSTV